VKRAVAPLPIGCDLGMGALGVCSENTVVFELLSIFVSAIRARAHYVGFVPEAPLLDFIFLAAG